MKYINKTPNELMYHILMDEISIYENDKFLIIKIIEYKNILYEVKNKKARKTFTIDGIYRISSEISKETKYQIYKLIDEPSFAVIHELNIPNLVINGNLYCSYNKLTSLPENLTINGILFCRFNDITLLPENLVVNGSLDCSFNQLQSLPDTLQVSGKIYAEGNNLKYIPEHLKHKVIL